MANNSFDLKNIGVVYLSDLTLQDFPSSEVGVGHVLWNGSGFVVQTDNQGPVYTSVPSYNIAQQSLEVYEPNDTVVIPTYSVVTGDYRLRDSQGNDYVPRASVAAQNVGVSGSTSVQSPTTETLGTAYLAAGTLASASCAAYMKLENSGGPNHPKTEAVVYLNSLDNQTTYGTLIQSLAIGAGSVENVIAMTNLVAIPSDGWYRLEANVDQANSTVTLYGLRLGYTG